MNKIIFLPYENEKLFYSKSIKCYMFYRDSIQKFKYRFHYLTTKDQKDNFYNFSYSLFSTHPIFDFVEILHDFITLKGKKEEVIEEAKLFFDKRTISYFKEQKEQYKVLFLNSKEEAEKYKILF